MLETLAAWCYRRRRTVLIAWIVAFVVIGVVGKAFDGGFSTDFSMPGADSTAAQNLLNSRFPARAGDTVNVVFRADGGVEDPIAKAALSGLLAKYRSVPHVVGITSPYDPNGRGQVSPDGHIGFAVLQLDVQGRDMPVASTKRMISEARAANSAGLKFALGGTAIQQAEFSGGGSEEGYGILAAVIILLITFGSVLAMGLPILTALMGIGIGLGIVELLANVVKVPNFAPIVAAMVGIGVGIDYALFIVTRYRQGLHKGLDPERATVVAITTAGRAVLFAGTTVVISVMGMLLMNLPFLQGVSFGAAFAVLVTMLGSITLLPAMLGFTGRSIDKLRVPFVPADNGDHRVGFWFRWSRQIQRHPWLYGTAGLIAVVLLAVPMFSMKLGFPGETTLPKDRMSRQSYELISEGFGPGFTSPLVLAAQLPNRAAAGELSVLQGRLASAPGVAGVLPPQVNPAGDTAVVIVYPKGGTESDATKALVKDLRKTILPRELAGTGISVKVGGINAALADQDHILASRLPLFIFVVVALSFVLLMVVFRSVLVAVKAALMNLLSIAAAYGFLVAVVQWGWLRQLFGISASQPITNWIPMMMFAILFGLSMDYEVFLLSRIREEYARTGDNGLAVADGLAATARVITAAAAIMVTVFMSFVLGPEQTVKQVGIGFAAAIFIDATLIRMVLVPATMEVLGNANWWLPRWLDRVLPHVKFEEEVLDEPPSEPGDELAPEPALT